MFAQLREQAATWAKAGRRSVIAAWTRGSRERIAHLLRENGLKAEQADTWRAVGKLPVEVAAVVTLGVERGFITDTLSLVGEQDLLGERISRPARRRKRADQFIAEATEIADGALILVGGTLMLAPGFITDAFGILLILPFTRPVFRRQLAATVARLLVVGGLDLRRPGPGPAAGPVVRGEVVDYEPPSEG